MWFLQRNCLTYCYIFIVLGQDTTSLGGLERECRDGQTYDPERWTSQHNIWLCNYTSVGGLVWLLSFYSITKYQVLWSLLHKMILWSWWPLTTDCYKERKINLLIINISHFMWGFILFVSFYLIRKYHLFYSLLQKFIL